MKLKQLNSYIFNQFNFGLAAYNDAWGKQIYALILVLAKFVGSTETLVAAQQVSSNFDRKLVLFLGL